MSCRRSLEIELPEFLAEPGAAAFGGFRDHYPRCVDCAAEVRAWTELDAWLAAGAVGAAATHPEPEQLARYEALAAGERAGLDHHLAGCPACREELRQLRAFSPERLAEQVRAPLPKRSGRTRRVLGSLGQLVWSPAFAYAIAGLLLFPALRWTAEDAPMQIASAPARDDARDVFAVAEPAAPRLAKSRAPARSPALARAPSERMIDKVAKDEADASSPGILRIVPMASEAKHRAYAFGEGSRAREVSEHAFAESEEPAQKQIARLESRSILDKVVADAPPPAGELAVRLAPGATIEVEAPDAVAFVRLLIPVPASQAGATAAGLRLASADGRREMRERAALPAASQPRAAGAGLLAANEAASAPRTPTREIEWRIPRGWLEPGVYRVELSRPDGSPDGDSVTGLFFLVVRTP